MSSVPFVLNQRRLGAFAAVGALGFLLQLAALWSLMALARWTWLPATIVAVEIAVVHNFLWHERWTWRDRLASSAGHVRGACLSGRRFLRFNAATGLTSILGNAAMMGISVGLLGMPVIPANALAVGTMSVANFVVADRWVFKVRLKYDAASNRARTRCCAMSLAALFTAAASTRAETRLGPVNQPETVAAWNRYVAETEARLERSGTPPARAREAVLASGASIAVPSGTISGWRGSVFIPSVTLDRLLDMLLHPGTPPPQDDVVSSRVLSRGDDSLRVSIRLVRRAIVTVSYDTEHEMQFRRWTPTLATARSVATRIEEVGGADHGFLWRLHSYWRYRERDGGVLVDLESLTLSRDVPWLVRPIAAPLVDRIARESLVRTLEALRRYLES